VRPQITETTALGAAYLAGLAAGVWPGCEAIAAKWQVDRRFEPRITADESANRRATWRRAVERAKGWVEESDA
jgi:glycerol kinase